MVRLNRAITTLARCSVRVVPAERREWAEAVWAEAGEVPDPGVFLGGWRIVARSQGSRHRPPDRLLAGRRGVGDRRGRGGVVGLAGRFGCSGLQVHFLARHHDGHPGCTSIRTPPGSSGRWRSRRWPYWWPSRGSPAAGVLSARAASTSSWCSLASSGRLDSSACRHG